MQHTVSITDLRAPGSIGACSTPSRVFKGMRMAGRMGGQRVKMINLEIIKVLADKNVVLGERRRSWTKRIICYNREIMEFAIHNVTGKETGKKVKLDKDVFGVEPNEHSIYLDVKQYLANQRQGTNKAKGRGEVSYSTRKIKKQKGTWRRKSRLDQEWCLCWWGSNFRSRTKRLRL